MLVRSAPPITGSLPRRAGFNQMEKKDLSLIIRSVSSFNLTKRAPHVSCSLTSLYAAAGYCLWNTGVKCSDRSIYSLLFLSDGKTVTAEVPQGRSETLLIPESACYGVNKIFWSWISCRSFVKWSINSLCGCDAHPDPLSITGIKKQLSTVLPKWPPRAVFCIVI